MFKSQIAEISHPQATSNQTAEKQANGGLAVEVGISADHLKSEQGLKEAGRDTKPGVCDPEDIT